MEKGVEGGGGSVEGFLASFSYPQHLDSNDTRDPTDARRKPVPCHARAAKEGGQDRKGKESEKGQTTNERGEGRITSRQLRVALFSTRGLPSLLALEHNEHADRCRLGADAPTPNCFIEATLATR